MKDLTIEETITMLHGMLWVGGLARSEKEILEAAIRYLEIEQELIETAVQCMKGGQNGQ